MVHSSVKSFSLESSERKTLYCRVLHRTYKCSPGETKKNQETNKCSSWNPFSNNSYTYNVTGLLNTCICTHELTEERGGLFFLLFTLRSRAIYSKFSLTPGYGRLWHYWDLNLWSSNNGCLISFDAVPECTLQFHWVMTWIHFISSHHYFHLLKWTLFSISDLI